jgi:hypothetical protein
MNCRLAQHGAVQYWRSMDHLVAYARNKEAKHLPAWRAFNKAIGTMVPWGSGTRHTPLRQAPTRTSNRVSLGRVFVIVFPPVFAFK